VLYFDLSFVFLLCSQGVKQTEVLEAGATVNYVWDDLGSTHKLVVTIQGDLNLDSNSVHIYIENAFKEVYNECLGALGV
jgi:hypothetical protein